MKVFSLSIRKIGSFDTVDAVVVASSFDAALKLARDNFQRSTHQILSLYMRDEDNQIVLVEPVAE